MKTVEVKVNRGRRDFRQMYEALESAGEVFVKCDMDLRRAISNRLAVKYRGKHTSTIVLNKAGEVEGVKITIL